MSVWYQIFVLRWRHFPPSVFKRIF